VVRNLKNKRRPDVAILDVKLSKFSGFKILHLMGADPELRCIPVIVLSSRVTPDDVQKAVPWGRRNTWTRPTHHPDKAHAGPHEGPEGTPGGGPQGEPRAAGPVPGKLKFSPWTSE
jgi:CheY-like chemotaxis protein